MKYKATIVIPCYNKEDYVEKSLDSLIKLSRFNDFEIILVDDCSKDDTVLKIKKYTEKYENIKLYVLDRGSGSPSKPRNTGIEKSTTNYLIFMDPDDEVINDGYSVLLTKMEEYQSDILIGARVGVNEYGQHVFTDFIDENYTYINSNDYRIKLDLLNRGPFILKTIYSKKLLIDNNIKFNENITTSEDEAFDMRCVAKAKKITKINDIVYQYTSGATGSITTNVSLKVYKELYDVMVELNDAYSLIFSKEMIAERIIDIIYIFYMRRLTYLKSFEEIEEACDYIYDAFQRYGFEHFDKLTSRKSIVFVDDIKNKKISKYIDQYFIRRLNELSKKLLEANKKNKKNEKTLNRKMVKISLGLISIISKIKKIKTKLKKRKQSKKIVSPEKINYETKFNEFYSSLTDKCNDYWVFMDRRDNAKDNGEALYRYVMKNKIHDKIAFILDKSSNDYERLLKEGFNLIEYDSIEHWEIQKNCSILFASHCDRLYSSPWYYCENKKQNKKINNYKVKTNFKIFFLQHGVIRCDMSEYLNGNKYYKIVTSSKYEKDSLLNISKYRLTENEIVLSGLPRWDYLKDKSKNVITIFPTWRKEIFISKTISDNEKEFIETEFYKNWYDFLNSNVLKDLSKHFTINLISHYGNMHVLKFFENKINKNINIISYNDVKNFYDIVNETKIFITDYSSFSFDYLYLNKPVIYFDFEENALKNNIKNMEYSNYGFYCTDVNEAEDALNYLKENNYKTKPEFSKNINKLFAYRDSNNCKRVIDAIKKTKK